MPLQAVLYVSHGTRLVAGQREARSFITSIQSEVDIPLQAISYLELNSPSIEEATIDLVKKGASAISVVPVLLLSAKHYNKDIPQVIHKLQKLYPHVHFTYGKPLNVQNRIVKILEERILEQRSVLQRDAKVLLVGRGSFEPQIKSDIETIAFRLAERIGMKRVDTCYLAACEPTFEQALVQAVESECSQIIIVPYLWFNGLLIQYMEKKALEYTRKDKEIVLCDQLGHHPVMKLALIDRVKESFNCEFSWQKEYIQ